MTGTTVGRYELLEKLGEGGMGVVYRARDVVLNRFAALKFLPQDTALDEERKRRFLQEAQLACSLNHPNIVVIYEIGLGSPRDFIAMEYVPGKPLDRIIGTTGLPAKEALAYGIQVADALAAAHSVGVVHRDVKPGNVIISDHGVAKVLDFGLAKLVERTSDKRDGDLTATVAVGSSPRTVEGAIVGTVAYMSPEQAEGKHVDHRSDIFAFGLMLYEMISGKRAFSGDSAMSTIAAILRADPPDLTVEMPDLPKELNRVVRRCLEKSPERRWQNMGDVRAILDDLKQDLQSGQWMRAGGTSIAVGAKGHSQLRRWALPAVGLVALAAAVALAFSRPRQAPVTPEAYVFRRLTSDEASNVAPAISRDGKLIVYSSDRAQSGTTDIWVQQVAGGEPVRLTTNLGLSHSPEFSPDGSRITFHGGPDARGIYVVSTFGGAARRVADGRGPEFSPDGSQIAYMGVMSNGIRLVPALGGTFREIPLKHNVVNRPRWLPDGKRLLYLGASPSDGGSQTFDWYTVSVDSGEEKSCNAGQWLKGRFARVIPHSVSSEGVFVYSTEGDNANVYRVPFDLTQARVLGAPVPVTMAPGINFWPSTSTDGTRIVFGNTPGFNTNLWSLNLDLGSGKITGEPRRITGGLVDRNAPYPSRDGKRLVYRASIGAAQEIRVLDLTSGQETRIGEATQATPPIISEDGTQIAYAVLEKEGLAIYVVPVAGGVARQICTGCGRPTSWIQGGQKVLYDQAEKNTVIGVLDVNTGKSTTILRSAKNRIYAPRLSPDGRLLAFTRITDGPQRRTFVVPFTTDRQVPEEEWKPATEGPPQDERQQFWSPDGRFLFFLSERDGFRCVWGTRFDPRAAKAVGETVPVHHLHQYRYSLLDFNDVADVGLSIAGTTAYLAVREFQANIWLAERRPAEQR